MRKDGLSQKAYVPIKEGDSYDPFVDAGESLAEFTLKSVGLGILFGIIFGAANAYLGLRAGLTGLVINFMWACAGVRPPFLTLHFRQQQTRFSQLVSPPCDRGITWSRLRSDVLNLPPQYWQRLRSRA